MRTPFGKKDEALGGSGTYAALSASLFTTPSLISSVGEDFPKAYYDLLQKRNIDLTHLAIIQGEKTFRWKGMYEFDMNVAHTLETELNVLQYPPVLPDKVTPVQCLCLANMDPEYQLLVKEKVPSQWTAADTMNLWIETKRVKLLSLLTQIDLFFCNDGEARQLTEEVSLVKAAQKIQELGPKIVIIKKGEHGCLLSYKGNLSLFPAYPLENAIDPTGAGDSFAGTVCGYLSTVKTVNEANIKRALLLGSIVASFTVSAFSVEGILKLTPKKLLARYRELHQMAAFPSLSLPDTITSP